MIQTPTQVWKELFEEVHPEIAPEGLASPFRLYRYDKGTERYYFDESRNAYLSVTEFCSKVLGISYGLARWMMDMGEAAATHFKEMRAAYGTQLHIEIIEVLKSGKGDFYDIGTRAHNLAIELGYKYTALDWQNDMVNDVASFMIFAKEKELEVIAAEFPILSKKYGLAGCIDLPCRLKFNRSKVNAIIDIKSGRKGFFDSHRLQLHCYKTMWNDTFGDLIPMTHVFNWAPQPIKNKTKYKLENQSKHVYADTVENRMSLAKSEGMINPPTAHLEIIGKFEFESFNIEDHLYTREI